MCGICGELSFGGAPPSLQVLQEILPLCSYCRKIRDDEDYWHTVESYVSKHTDTRFSHGICPECYEKVVAEMDS